MRSTGMFLGLVLVLGLLAGCEEKPNNTGPTVHCFNQDVSTGKIQVTCPTGQ
jgi:hypothetical protein